jgi:hypothetical protein
VKHRHIIREIGFGLLCLALTLWFFHPAFYHRSATFLYNFDNTYQYYAWMHKLAGDWRAFTPPLWDFAVDAGLPFPGEVQTAAFYPINIGYVWLTGLPSPAKLDFLILLHFAGAMWGVSLFLRQRHINWSSSLFGGAVFCWIGPVAARASVQANIFNGLVYLPWVLFCFERGTRSGRWWSYWTGLCGFMLSLSLLAGHPQPFIHNALMLGFFAIFLCLERRMATDWWRLATSLAVVAIISFSFCFVQLASSHEYFARSYRWIGLPNPVKALQAVPIAAYNLYKLSPADLLSIINPHVSGGDCGTLFVTITALVCACVGLAMPGGWRWFALTVSGFVLMVALGSTTSLGTFVYHIPILNRVREPSRIIYLYQFCVATLAASGLQLITRGIPKRHDRILVVLAVSGLFAFEASRNANSVLGATNTPVSADLAYEHSPLIRALERNSLSSGSLYRVMARPNELIPPNGGDIFSFSTVVGHRSSMLISYFDFLNSNWSMTSPTLDQASARYVVTNEPNPNLLLLACDAGKMLYERRTARPIFRFQLEGDAAPLSTINEVTWKRNRVDLQVSVGQPARLIFAESAFPGWTVRVNGALAPLAPSGPFMSVDVRQGRSTVEWRYRPWWLVPGMLLWFMGGLAISIMGIPHRILLNLISKLRHARLFLMKSRGRSKRSGYSRIDLARNIWKTKINCG